MKATALPINIGHNEGWGLFNAQGELQIQRLDEAGVFVDDEQAWVHVAQKAHCGSIEHKEVLQLLREKSRDEWMKIMQHFKSITKDC